MDRAAFFESVHDALPHLYDFAHLNGHPLSSALGNSSPLPPPALHQILLRAIEQLRPPSSTPTNTVGWRQHRYLERRYVEGVSHEQIARELELSVRQAHRVRLSAMDAVAASLWEMRRPGEEPVSAAEQAAARAVRPNAENLSGQPEANSALEAELARLANHPVEVPSNLADELAGALALVRPLALGRGVLVDVEDPMPSVPLAVERGLLRQIFVLLFGHAIERQGTGRLFVAADVLDNAVTFDVVYLFTPGQTFPLENSRDPRLDAARRVVEALRGSLDMLPIDGSGCCLRLTVPRDHTSTVLVVDDNPDLAHLFAVYLKGTSYRVVHAKTARAAVRMASQMRPDVITLDVMMPFQDGWELFRHLKSNPVTATTPIVVCSILPERDVALAMGATEFLAKPVSAVDLMSALRQCHPADSAAHPSPTSNSP